jgi:NADH:ubiquinone oxidoreductase subunit F (NADH-binding)
VSTVALRDPFERVTPRGDGPRLLPDGRTSSPRSWADHLDRYGPLPSLGDGRALLAAVEQSGLTGRGGAGFPTAVKLRTLASKRSALVVANGVEGELASAKDQVLMTESPHLVVDGVLAAAAAVDADEAIIAVSRNAHSSYAGLESALAERRPELELSLVAAPPRFVAGEESALVHWLNGGEAKPTFTPPRPFERGVQGRPTLVQNVETLANIGLIARYGPDWFRRADTADEPGTALVTITGAVRRPGVVEAELGTPLRELIDRCGGLAGPARALLVGGYFGSWIPALGSLDLPLSEAALRRLGAALGARTIAILPDGACGLAETARIARYLAGESAGQCGPCLFGLEGIADALESIAAGRRTAPEALDRLGRLPAQIAGRGACGYPDGALQLVQSALRVFADEIEGHLAGRCSGSHAEPLLPTQSASSDWR